MLRFRLRVGRRPVQTEFKHTLEYPMRLTVCSRTSSLFRSQGGVFLSKKCLKPLNARHRDGRAFGVPLEEAIVDQLFANGLYLNAGIGGGPDLAGMQLLGGRLLFFVDSSLCSRGLTSLTQPALATGASSEIRALFSAGTGYPHVKIPLFCLLWRWTSPGVHRLTQRGHTRRVLFSSP